MMNGPWPTHGSGQAAWLNTIRHGGEAEGEVGRADGLHRARAEDEEEDAQGGEDPCLHDGHCVQERAHRGGGDHGGGQPAVHRHDRVLGEAEEAQAEDHEEQRGMLGDQLGREDAAALEVEVPGLRVDQDEGREQADLRRAQEVDDVFARAGFGLVRLLVTHQGLGDQGQGFIKQE